MKKAIMTFPMFLALSTLPITAGATAPSFIPLQGVLTDENGTPLNESIDIRFTIYDAEIGGTALWAEVQDVLVENGFFTVYLGQVQPLDLSLFRDYSELWLGTQVGADPEMPTVYLGSVPFSGFAEHCGNIPDHSHSYSDITGTAAPDDVSFNYAGSTSKGGPAIDVSCTECIQSGDIQNGEVTSSDVGFNFAASTSKGGPAMDVSCSDCIQSGEIQDGEVSSSDVGFNYAGSSIKGGAAADVSCANCVALGGETTGSYDSTVDTIADDGVISSGEVNFNYADSSIKGGAAIDLSCSSCVSSAEIIDGSITAADMQDGSALAEILDDDGTGSGLAADRVDGYHASELRTGVDYIGGEQDLELTDVGQIVRAVTITAPSAGYVIVNVSGSFYLANGAVDFGHCGITTGASIDTGYSFVVLRLNSDGNNPLYIPFAATRGFSVSSGSNTFNLVCAELLPGTDIHVLNGNITAIFIPNRY